jgi:hypothetical protein
MNTAVAAAAENNHQVAAVTEKELIVRTNGREFSVGFAKAQFCYIYCTFSSDLSTERTPFAFFFCPPTYTSRLLVNMSCAETNLSMASSREDALRTNQEKAGYKTCIAGNAPLGCVSTHVLLPACMRVLRYVHNSQSS